MTGAPRLPVALVAAVARNGVIGARNALPWRLPGDLRHFKATTMGKPVVMGRKTFESIGGPLPGRSLVVVSRDQGWRAPSIEAALDLATTIGRANGAAEIVVAGGGTLYEVLITVADRLRLTEVDLAPDGDTGFPAIDPAFWRETERRPQEPGPRDEARYAFVTYERR